MANGNRTSARRVERLFDGRSAEDITEEDFRRWVDQNVPGASASGDMADSLWADFQAQGGGSSAGPGGEIRDLIEELVSEAKLGKQEADAAIRAWESGGLQRFKDILTKSGAMERDAVEGLADFFAQQQDIKYGDAPEELVSQAAMAEADPQGRAAQRSAIDLLKERTGTEITAAERFMMAEARQAEERDQRAAREAALRDLESRGIRSGAAEMGAFLGGQGITSRNRMMQDLGAQANAVERSMLATQLLGEQGSQLAGDVFREQYDTGTAIDNLAKFNTEMGADYEEKRARFDLDKQGQTFDQRMSVADREVGRAVNTAARGESEAAMGLGTTKLKADVNTSDNPYLGALRFQVGGLEAERARKEIGDEEEGFNLLNPGTWF